MDTISTSPLVRRAAKAFILREGRLVMTEGKHGTLNLPGGGIDPGETSEQALIRELGEELQLRPEQIGQCALLGYMSGLVGHSELYVAGWEVLQCEISAPINAGSEVCRIHLLSRKEVIVHPRVSSMARNACQNYLRNVA